MDAARGGGAHVHNVDWMETPRVGVPLALKAGFKSSRFDDLSRVESRVPRSGDANKTTTAKPSRYDAL